jgi:dienelactone hydrolase
MHCTRAMWIPLASALWLASCAAPGGTDVADGGGPPGDGSDTGLVDGGPPDPAKDDGGALDAGATDGGAQDGGQPDAGAARITWLDGGVWSHDDGTTRAYGALRRPAGTAPPYAAVIMSHGTGGSAENVLVGPIADALADAGYVLVSADYTHCNPAGHRHPVDAWLTGAGAFGASTVNLDRMSATIAVLESLGDVDPAQLYAYGFSRGAYVTIRFTGTRPGRLRAGAFASGGYDDDNDRLMTTADKHAMVTPLAMFQGSVDGTTTAQRSWDLKLDLDRRGVPNERYLYEGLGHGDMVRTAVGVPGAIARWFASFSTSAAPEGADRFRVTAPAQGARPLLGQAMSLAVDAAATPGLASVEYAVWTPAVSTPTPVGVGAAPSFSGSWTPQAVGPHLVLATARLTGLDAGVLLSPTAVSVEVE